ncbi:alpha/beta hydrolase [Pseudoalteromonas rubra]|uniref:Alpha/beta hydrolase n=1 Tax=Pseudoalteromonas rubra TaxID=43658 RepID=A0A4Q7EH44_9GAMM|nr:alpha/beta fold hydrolase [Pseudoalteromonas rubra]RZM81013.1 alpha/beta hydrolase [Pseudoalteromonas rubra]
MSDKIYFKSDSRFNFKKHMLNVATRVHHRIAPGHAEKTATKLLLTPVRAKPKHAAPADLIEDSISSKEGLLKTYRVGNGPVWVLTHGWSGSANQFFPLMQHIAAQGYTALAFDHPAHGNSEGEVGHLPGFVSGLEAVLDSLDETQGVIAHSMGCAAAIECQHPKLSNKPLLLIAPVLDYVSNLFGSIERSGYSMRLFRSVVSKVENEYNYPMASVDPFEKLKNRTAHCIIVHDQHDRFAQFTVSKQAATQMCRVKLIETQGLGHGRILQSQQAKDAFDALIR